MKTIKKMTPVLLLLSFLLSFSSCDKEILLTNDDNEIVEPVDPIDPDDNTGPTDEIDYSNRRIIENQVFTTTTTFYGHEHDSLVIRNCTFENISGEGLILGDVDEVIVEDCIFRNITGNAVRFATLRTSNNILVKDNKIYNIGNCGVLSQEGHTRVKIMNNDIYDVAKNPEKGPHGIYVIGEDFVIEGNKIWNNGGACITSRTYGTISRNQLYTAAGSGVDYSCDHPGFGGTLIIENNIIYDNTRKGIHIMGGPHESKIGKAIIRFNTVLSSNNEMAIWVDSGHFPKATFEVYGNLLINSSGTANFLFVSPQHQLEFEGYNLTATENIGFVDFGEFGKRDLHITSNSKANNYVVGITDFPKYDFDGMDQREQSAMDAGADEFNL